MSNYQNWVKAQKIHEQNALVAYQLSMMCRTLQMQLDFEILRNQQLTAHLKNTFVKQEYELTNHHNDNIKNQAIENSKKQIQMPNANSLQRKKRVFECKIETKNLPKNFGKAIITYIQQNQIQVKEYLSRYQIDYQSFLSILMEKRSLINTIMSLRQLWIQSQEFPYAKQTREISMYFLRKHSFRYIFNSRVKNMHGHIKYRKRLIEALENPEEFTSIKTLSYKWTGSKRSKIK